MKKTLLLFVFAVLSSTTFLAQNNVILDIDHKLGNEIFAMNTACSNNLGDDFKFNRLEYYICEFTIVHDGGQEIEVNDLWVLVQADENNPINLGSFDVTNVEVIKFKVGVDPDHNHLDPSTYDSAHPLAPKNPSMHWGWNPGYRFIALEGNTGADFNQVVQLHGLGDGNYFEVIVDVNAVAYGGELNINVVADYEKCLENIDMTGGLIVHGENQEARTALQNMRDFVFSASGAVSVSEQSITKGAFSVYPNPTEDGNISLEINSFDNTFYQVSVTDICGKQVAYFKNFSGTSSIDLNIDQAGFYFVNLISNGKIIASKKMISK